MSNNSENKSFVAIFLSFILFILAMFSSYISINVYNKCEGNKSDNKQVQRYGAFLQAIIVGTSLIAFYKLFLAIAGENSHWPAIFLLTSVAVFGAMSSSMGLHIRNTACDEDKKKDIFPENWFQSVKWSSIAILILIIFFILYEHKTQITSVTNKISASSGNTELQPVAGSSPLKGPQLQTS